MLNIYMEKFDAEKKKKLLAKRRHFELALAVCLQLLLITGFGMYQGSSWTVNSPVRSFRLTVFAETI